MASDTELTQDVDPGVVDLAANADVLIIDGMYTREQYQGTFDGISRKSWGHSTWEKAVSTAKSCTCRAIGSLSSRQRRQDSGRNRAVLPRSCSNQP